MDHPVLVHCLAGSGKTAIFLMIASTMAEIDVGGGGNVDMAGNSNLIPNMVQMASPFACLYIYNFNGCDQKLKRIIN